jgi:hypothetical protein
MAAVLGAGGAALGASSITRRGAPWGRGSNGGQRDLMYALRHRKMRDWEALRAQAAAHPLAEKAPKGALRLILRQARNKAKKARQLTRRPQ